MTPAVVQALAAVATFFAASLAVWATFRAPKLAAKFAEDLRAQSVVEDEKRRLKLYIFSTLMQFRGQITNPSAVASLNLIDVVFTDSQTVREAWRLFVSATEEKPSSIERIFERYLAIIEKIARELGLEHDITISDIQRAYYPEALGKMDEMAQLEVDARLNVLRAPSK